MSTEIVFSKMSVERRPEHQQMTQILKSGKEMVVRKKACNEKAIPHIQEYITAYEHLSDVCEKNAGIEILPCVKISEEEIEFPFLTGNTLSEDLKDKKPQEYSLIVKDFWEKMQKSIPSESFEVSDGFKSVFGEHLITDSLDAWRGISIDLNFDNIFVLEKGHYTLIDYEWFFPFLIPKMFILYRALLSDTNFGRFSAVDKKKIFSDFKITGPMRSAYWKMEEAFQLYVAANEMRLDHLMDKRRVTNISAGMLSKISRITGSKGFRLARGVESRLVKKQYH